MDNILSIGSIAGQLQIPVCKIHQYAVLLGIEPALKINDVSHYREADVARLADHVQAMQHARAAALHGGTGGMLPGRGIQF